LLSGKRFTHTRGEIRTFVRILKRFAYDHFLDLRKMIAPGRIGKRFAHGSREAMKFTPGNASRMHVDALFYPGTYNYIPWQEKAENRPILTLW